MKQAYYNATRQISDSHVRDPSLCPSFSFRDRFKRGVWKLCWLLLYRPSPRPFHSWRAWLLRMFGAKIGTRCHFYPGSKIWAPWNLLCEDRVTAGDGAEIYNPAPMYFGSHAIISHGAYICSATHHYDDPQFPLIAHSMKIGSYPGCARAIVGPGANIADGAVMGLASVATRDLEAWSVLCGNAGSKCQEQTTPPELQPIDSSIACNPRSATRAAMVASQVAAARHGYGEKDSATFEWHQKRDPLRAANILVLLPGG